MGRQSVKQDKNIYFKSREDAGLTRDAASRPGLSPDRIEKIESGKTNARAEDILIMSEAYKKPELINYYCTNECPIGKKTVIPVSKHELSQIALSMLKSLGDLDTRKNNLIDICIDNRIDDDELPEFIAIKESLTEIAATASAMQLWVDSMIASGEISPEAIEEAKKNL
ncbi:MAG: helix-turn-helix transcriptional regulator [Saccharofermentans sp.]|nr:helix-turn-helix transcriptional regulator [Saccharofermentans sp.]